MSEDGKSSRGKWAAVAGIATALITSLTTLALAVITSGNVDYRLEEQKQASNEKVETSVSAAAVDLLWLKERVQRLEVDVAVEKALRKGAEDRLSRMEGRLLHRGSGGGPTEAARHVEIVAQAKEDVKSNRPPKPKPDDARVQKMLKAYFGKKK